MDITIITFREGGDVEFPNKQPEFFNTDGVDFIGIGIGSEQVAVYPRDEVLRVTVETSN